MFDSERDRKLEELFMLAADLPADERTSFYERHCGEDHAMRLELEELLRQDEEGTKDFLVSPVLDTRPPSTVEGGNGTSGLGALPSPGVSFMPERIGRYLILERVGEGGMGSVYLAEQEQPVRRQVALKIVKPGMDTERVIQRFEMERQALALMDHPCIARIFDGGATQEGRPYFAMEYAPGRPITRFCDREKLTIRERLELFCKVCEGVQHAHQKGIIHRDIKPSNVLVSRIDGKIVPKIIDFGIARATTESADDGHENTKASEVVGTTYYMSPEQSAPDGAHTDTRSDIYSLGVLLYELLAGVLPFDTKELRERSPAEVRSILAELDPVPPSVRFARLSASTDDETKQLVGVIAERRDIGAERLVELLAGDLDWVALRAMEKLPGRRYATAAGFAADVRRHLAHEPVLAGPPDVAYRMRKFIRRNRMTVVSATLVVLALICGTIGATWGMFAAAKQRDAALGAKAAAEAAEAEAGRLRREAERASLEAERQRAVAVEQRDEAINSKQLAEEAQAEADRQRLESEHLRESADEARRSEAQQRLLAEREAEQLKSITDFLVETLSLADSRESLDPTSSLEAMLAHAGSEVEEAFRGFPKGEAVALQVIGEGLHSLGRLEDAERYLRRALEIQEGTDGVATEKLYDITARLAEVYDESDSRDAYELSVRAHRLAAAVVHQYHGPALANALHQLVGAAERLDVEWALQHLERVQSIAPRALEEHDEHWLHVADVLQFVGRIFGYQWGLADGIPLLEEALEIRRLELPVTHPKIAVTINHLVTVLNQHGRHEEAEELAKESLLIYETVLPEDHWLLSETRSLLGECLSGQGYFIAAEDLLLPAHAAIIDELGFGRAGIDSTYRLVKHFESTGRPELASKHRAELAEALAFSRNAPWSWSRQAATFPPELVELTDAVAEMDAIMRDAATVFVRDDPLQWRMADAVERVIERRHALLADDDPLAVIVARVMAEYAQITKLDRGYATDRLMAEEILLVLRPHQQQLTRSVTWALLQLADAALVNENDAVLAEEYAGQAWELLREQFGPVSIETVSALRGLCNALMAQDRNEDARALLASAWEQSVARLGFDHDSSLTALEGLMYVFENWGRPTMFETILEKHLKRPFDDASDAFRLDRLAYQAVRTTGFSSALYEHALRAALRATELAPRSGPFFTTLGEAYYRLGRFEEAREALERSSALTGGMYLEAWPFLIMTYAELGDEDALDSALEELDHVIDVVEGRLLPDEERFIDEAETLLSTSPAN